MVVRTPDGSDKILLHACCAPCSGAIIECLLENDIQPVIYYSNSNIFPLQEYQIRSGECSRWADYKKVIMVEDEYDHQEWQEWIKGLENEPERGGRCLECFRFRLLRAARYAIEHGFTLLTTTLASSRWKNLDQINEAGQWAVTKANEELHPATELQWWDQNWRKGGLQPR
ncbi:MAG: epoxyqueuosine reductase QueH, partial [Bacteroidales bacterium]|nr:epoxyqueuosine reductase QueH [Bacteroidales bacterium]